MKHLVVSVLLAMSAGATTVNARAHPGHDRSARLIEVDLSANPATLKYGYVFEAADSEALRKLADQNADGEVSVPEGQAEQERWGAELRRQLSVCSGATKAALSCAKLPLDRQTAATATAWRYRPGKPLSVVWEFRLELAPEDRVFELQDAWVRADVDRTDAAVAPPQDARVTKVASNSASPSASEPRFRWNADRAGETRELAIAWEPPPSRWTVLTIVGGACVLAGLQLFATWRRRARKSV